MADFVLIGMIINTFGIKGEVKILTNFEFKDRVFIKGFPLFLGEDYQKEVVNTHRVHKNYDLVTFGGYTNINEVLKYKGLNVYVNKADLKLKDDEYLLSDLIGLEVYDGKNLIGVVIAYNKNNQNVYLKVKGKKDFYLPLIAEYIEKVNLQERKIMTKGGSNLIL